MKIAITSAGPTLDDQVEARFGRCAYFLIVDTDSMELEAIENPNITVGGGAGIQSAQLMAEKGVQAVLTGNCGPNAFQVFSAAGIQVIVGVNGCLRDVVAQYNQGLFTSTSGPNVVSHFGMSAGGPAADFDIGGGGMGQGMGGGRGMGRGMGRGIGRSMGMGAGLSSAVNPGDTGLPRPPAPELDPLKTQARAMEEQLNAVNERIAGLQGVGPVSPLIAVVDVEKCVLCGVCVDICPVFAITMNNAAEVDQEKCTGCGKCILECSQDALSLHARS